MENIHVEVGVYELERLSCKKVHSRTDFHAVLISLDNDQLSTILIATITTSAIKSLSDGVRYRFNNVTTYFKV